MRSFMYKKALKSTRLVNLSYATKQYGNPQASPKTYAPNISTSSIWVNTELQLQILK